LGKHWFSIRNEFFDSTSARRKAALEFFAEDDVEVLIQHRTYFDTKVTASLRLSQWQGTSTPARFLLKQLHPRSQGAQIFLSKLSNAIG